MARQLGRGRAAEGAGKRAAGGRRKRIAQGRRRAADRTARPTRRRGRRQAESPALRDFCLVQGVAIGKVPGYRDIRRAPALARVECPVCRAFDAQLWSAGATSGAEARRARAPRKLPARAPPGRAAPDGAERRAPRDVSSRGSRAVCALRDLAIDVARRHVDAQHCAFPTDECTRSAIGVRLPALALARPDPSRRARRRAVQALLFTFERRVLPRVPDEATCRANRLVMITAYHASEVVPRRFARRQ